MAHLRYKIKKKENWREKWASRDVLNKEYNFYSLIPPYKGFTENVVYSISFVCREMLFVSGLTLKGGYYKNISSPWNVAWPAGISLEYKTFDRSID